MLYERNVFHNKMSIQKNEALHALHFSFSNAEDIFSAKLGKLLTKSPFVVKCYGVHGSFIFDSRIGHIDIIFEGYFFV